MTSNPDSNRAWDCMTLFEKHLPFEMTQADVCVDHTKFTYDAANARKKWRKKKSHSDSPEELVLAQRPEIKPVFRAKETRNQHHKHRKKTTSGNKGGSTSESVENLID
ncbi:hypothetical protein scyTo_0024778 [Scyliorhinus torazame]|uniref:Uncharacterized protein n=1 Tax=Scyliorhinus torazame TaxID=75743 RepID=A0A401QFG5_SCYTO|nr:hypothetical protein [Scyliorhinus torazame]